jgi:sugar phosphate isomerase/epimerase
MKTRTGGFEIGFRRGWSDWQKDLSGVVSWANDNDLRVLDLGRDGAETIQTVQNAGVRVGTVDLLEWNGMISPDAGVRREAVAKNVEYVKSCGAVGPLNHFVVMLPEKSELSRRENFGYMVESFNQLAPALEEADARIAIEGWPGPGALCCTPEGYRAFFKECSSKSMGINYDPSHLIRMGINPLRFVQEFADRVVHVHGKDTEMFSEAFYEYGTELPATFKEGYGFGAWHWRYTIPGHGQMRWSEAFRVLESVGYKGAVCIELEDANFNGTDDGEKAGLLFGARYLESC